MCVYARMAWPWAPRAALRGEAARDLGDLDVDGMSSVLVWRARERAIRAWRLHDEVVGQAVWEGCRRGCPPVANEAMTQEERTEDAMMKLPFLQTCWATTACTFQPRPSDHLPGLPTSSREQGSDLTRMADRERYIRAEVVVDGSFFVGEFAAYQELQYRISRQTFAPWQIAPWVFLSMLDLGANTKTNLGNQPFTCRVPVPAIQL